MRLHNRQGGNEMRSHEGTEGWCAPLPPAEIIIGRSPAMRSIRERLEKVAPTDVPVLIQGASGTGKEVLARWIHACSPRRNRPFAKVHCPAVPGPLLESELFGHEEGAFTGAVHTKPGRIEDADGGTLLLDEIGEMDLNLQAKLLQLLQDGQMCRVGGREERGVDVRVICASHRDLKSEVQAGTFRPDLYYRINVVAVELPPLRDRRDDIPDLADYFVRLFNGKYHRNLPPLSPASVQLLLAHSWPGNLRELENLINRYVIFGSEEGLAADLLGAGEPAPAAPTEPISLRKIARQASLDAQRRVILEVLHANRWNRRQAARALHISYRALLYKIHDTGIPSRKNLQNWPGVPSLRPN